MTIYRLIADTSYRCVCWDQESPTTDRAEFEFVKQFWQGRHSPWVPPPLRFVTLREDLESEDEDVARARFEKGVSDCPFYSAAVLLLSERARHGLSKYLENAGELLPVPIRGDGTFFAFNCTTVLEALDTDRSSIEFFSSGNPRQVGGWRSVVAGGDGAARRGRKLRPQRPRGQARRPAQLRRGRSVHRRHGS